MTRQRIRAIAALSFLAGTLCLVASACVAAPTALSPNEAGPLAPATDPTAVSSNVASPLPSTTDPTAARERAKTVLAAWPDAVAAAGNRASVTPIGELTAQIGDWGASVGDNNKRSLMAGNVATSSELSEEAPPDGTVTWPDGTSAKVPLMAAQQAVGAISSTTEAPCSDCKPILLTDAQLTSGTIQTTRGPATAPIWAFSVQGSAVKVTRVAIANAQVVPHPGDGDPGLSPPVESASGTVGGLELTVAFVGAPSPGDQPCGEDYTGEAVESDLAVVVIVTRHPHAPPQICPAVGARRTTTATLAAPIGDRVVLDLRQGTPVPVVLAP
jgi:hypothetical protein